MRYARWDLSTAILVEPHTNACLSTLYPQDKLDNATGLRRTLANESKPQHETPSTGIAPLLKELIAQYAATGLPPAYIPTEHKTEKEDN